MNDAPTRRQSGTPHAWQAKAVLRRIREACDRQNTVCSAIATYCALTEIASDAAKDEFNTTHAWIAHMSGLGVRTVQARLRQLADIGAISITTPDLRAPSTYRLLAFGNGCATSGNGCVAFGNGQKHATLPTSEEHKKNKKEVQKNPSPSFAIPESLSSPEFESAWSGFLEHRKQLRKPVTPKSGTALLAKIAGWGREIAIEALNQSVENGWQGVFEPKGNTNSKAKRQKKYDKGF